MFGTLPTLALLGLGTPEILIICFLILLLFGAKRLPDLARGLGKSLSEFKKASKEAENEIRQSIEEQPKTPPPTKPSGNIPPAANS
ncbi:MAG TPA: twin-arginine translocase TatA/TatE family subunit [Opitutaceae bacterium]|nr:twin-arginine translocase TatA/TatE family subunit [Opitutaceae bacterium]